MSGDPHGQIIIIRRKRGGHHDAHHGGVWKIAYADFVTAMMAFFLVMWLINASNEETKAAVASYFNPVKLMDTTSNPKGVKDAEYGASSKDVPADKDTPAARSDARPADNASTGDAEKAAQMDETVFRDPYAVLAEIAGGTGVGAEDSKGEEAGRDDTVPRPGMQGGLAYRDPFEPEFWAERQPPSPAGKAEPAPEAQDAPTLPAEAADPATLAEQALEAASTPTKAVAPETPAPESKPEPAPESSVAQELRDVLAATPGGGPQVTVSEGDGTITIDMTDGADFSMFELGSARPKRDVVLLMEKIAAALKDKPGHIEISGHTDARPFKGGGYDNWRLSSARAQMAFYMLTRAGIGETRIRSVTGHADRLPRKPDDPLDAANRRIEIRLVQPGGGAGP